jgi:transposase
MKVEYRRCAGLDVHKDVVVACVRVTTTRRGTTHEVRKFDTKTAGLAELAEWLEKNRCTHAAMEATGVYWKPVWHMLEGQLQLVLANAAHIKNVPGRKTDVNDATWIADLLAHGLVESSFVPPTPIQEVRELTRTRKQLVREIGQHAQRVQKVLEDANVKLASVISDVLGASGRRILKALIEGEEDPVKLAALRDTRLKTAPQVLVEALRGRVREHHRFLLRRHLEVIEQLEKTCSEFDQRLEVALDPFRADVERLLTIHGVGKVAAQVIIGEIGTDMSRFPSAAHLRSWAGLCPRMDESAGKRRSTRLRKAGGWLKPVLVQCAWAATRQKEGYLRSQFFALKARRGPKKAIMAVAASILTAAYSMLKNKTDYRDLGADYLTRLDKDRIAKRLTKRLQALGYDVDVRKAA